MRDLKGFMREADGVIQARFATMMREHGFHVERDVRTGAAVLPVIPERMNSTFSKRTNAALEIAKHYTKDKGENWEALSKRQQDARMNVAMHSLDQRRYAGKDDVANFADWQFQHMAAGWTPPSTFKFIGPPLPPLTHEQKLDKAKDVADEWLAKRFQNEAVIKHWDLRLAALQGLIETGTEPSLADISILTKRMWTEGIVHQGEKTALLFTEENDKRYYSVTTRLHYDQEREFVSLMQNAAADKSGSIGWLRMQYHLSTSGLTFEGAHGAAQQAAIERTSQAGRFSLIVAAAGAGKTTALQPLVAAWKSRDQEIWAGSLAWRQADDMQAAGIDRFHVQAYSVLIERVQKGEIKLNRNSVVAIDEWALLGTKQALDLLRLQKKYDFTLVALADDKQASAIEAGDIIKLARRALGPENIPVINTTIRQQTDREKRIAGMLRNRETGPALDMKRQDGTAFMTFGGREQVIAKTAELYMQRLRSAGEAPTVSVPTNADAHQVSIAIREQRQRASLIGVDLKSFKVSDNDGRAAYLKVAKGDTLRLFQSTYGDSGRAASGRGGKGGVLVGRNGSIVTVLDVEQDGIRLRNAHGKMALVRWANLNSKKNAGHLALGYGYAMTIHTAQGSTAAGHIVSLPDGSQSVTGKEGYSAMTRHKHWSALVTNEQAELIEVRKSRPINSTMDITLDDKWANVARNLAWQPDKDNALDMIDRAVKVRQGAVRLLRQAMDLPDPAKPDSNVQQMRDVVHTHWLNRAYDRVRRSLGHDVSRDR